MAAPELVELTSPYRLILSPIIDYVLDVERSRPDQQIAVLVPELDERNRCPWSQRLFDNLPTPVSRKLGLLTPRTHSVCVWSGTSSNTPGRDFTSRSDVTFPTEMHGDLKSSLVITVTRVFMDGHSRLSRQAPGAGNRPQILLTRLFVDHGISNALRPDTSLRTPSNAISKFGVIVPYAVPGTMWFLGVATHNSHTAEAGRLGAEAELDSEVVMQVLKFATNRPRPNLSNNQSFPSGHAMSAFALAAVISREYHDKPLLFSALMDMHQRSALRASAV